MTEPIDAFQMGKAALPLAAASTGKLVKDTDPAIYHLGLFLKWGLERHIGARLAAEATAANVPVITEAVSHLSWRDPAPLITSEQCPTPLLAVYRKSEQISEHTQVRAAELTKVEVLYALPPLTAGGLERLSSILVAAKRVFLNFARELKHVSYTPPGGTLGQDVRDVSGINFCMMKSASYGDVAGFAKGLYLPALLCTFDLSEVETTQEALLDLFDRAETSLDLKDGATDTTLADTTLVYGP